MSKFGRKDPLRDAARAATLRHGSPPAGSQGGTDAATLGGYTASDFLSPQYIVLAADDNLTNERVLTAGGHIDFSDGGAGNALTVDIDLTATFAWTGTHTHAADVDPATNYTVNLGSLSKKYLTLHAAELWVETLVAQNTLATIGGRVLVGPTTSLIADLSTGATSIDVKHNNLASGDRVVLEANGNLEWLAITSSATTITGGYRYNVARNLDGSGANVWYAGDAVFNTGTTGDGFIDLYSLAGIVPGSTAGPTIVGMVRTGTTYSAITARWAIGNLKGLYGKSSDTYGSAFGDYSGGNYLVTDENGLALYGAGGVLGINQNGITISLSSAWAAGRAYGFNVSGTNVGGVGGYTNASYNALEAKAVSTNKGAITRIAAETTSSYSAQILLQALGASASHVKIMGTSTETGVGISGALSVGATIYGNISGGAGDIRYQGVLGSHKGGTVYDVYPMHYLTTPLTHTSWDGNDLKSTGTYTITPATFGYPSNAKAVLVRLKGYFGTAGSGSVVSVKPYGYSSYPLRLRGHTANTVLEKYGPVPTGTSGQIEVVVTGASFGDAILEIHGYAI